MTALAPTPASTAPTTGVGKVLMVSTSYPVDLQDWRGLFMRHLADALGRHPELALSLWAPVGESSSNVHFDVAPDERQWLAELMTAGGIAHLMRRNGVRVAAIHAAQDLERRMDAWHARRASSGPT